MNIAYKYGVSRMNIAYKYGVSRMNIEYTYGVSRMNIRTNGFIKPLPPNGFINPLLSANGFINIMFY